MQWCGFTLTQIKKETPENQEKILQVERFILFIEVSRLEIVNTSGLYTQFVQTGCIDKHQPVTSHDNFTWTPQLIFTPSSSNATLQPSHSARPGGVYCNTFVIGNCKATEHLLCTFLVQVHTNYLSTTSRVHVDAPNGVR